MSTLKPDPSNARLHDERNRAVIAESLEQFGAMRPIIIGDDDVIYAGNATYEEATAQGIPIEILETDGSKLYAIRASHLSPHQLREYGIVDNRSNELSHWNTDELRKRLHDGDDLSKHWNGDELAALLYPKDTRHVEFDVKIGDNPYSAKLGSLIYEPEGDMPHVDSLANTDKRDDLVKRIMNARLDSAIQVFLIMAAQRHIVFDFHTIANYYAHADATVQALMEESALVIIDSDRAIELGYLKVKRKIDELADEAFALREEDDDE